MATTKITRYAVRKAIRNFNIAGAVFTASDIISRTGSIWLVRIGGNTWRIRRSDITSRIVDLVLPPTSQANRGRA